MKVLLKYSVNTNEENKNQEQEEIDSLKRQKENFLNIRRNKLSNLLKREYEQYHRELLSNHDTLERQREMMEEKLRALKNMRESERKQK